METTEIADTIHETAHEGHAAAHAAPAPDGFRRLAGIYLGVVAMLLSIATLGGANATKEMISANIHASDTYAYYQAKTIRQTYYQIAADQLTTQPDSAGDPAAAARRSALIERWRATAAGYESEPATGDGKKELLAKAHAWDTRRERAAERDPNFDYGVALFQIAIVLGSVAIVAASRALLVTSSVLAVLGSLFTLNGYLLLVPLPAG